MPPIPKTIDWKLAEGLCKIHCSADECAAVLHVDTRTLQRRCKIDNHETWEAFRERHMSEGKASLRRKQIEVALTGNPISRRGPR